MQLFTPASARWFAPISDIVRSRQLVFALAGRDIRIRYRETALGFAWAIFLPLGMVAVFSVIFGATLRSSTIPGGDTPYFLYALVGLLPWNFFASGVSQSANCLYANRGLITKSACAREVFPVSCVLTVFVDLIIGLSVLSGLLAWRFWNGEGRGFVGPTIFWFAPYLTALILITMGMGLLVAAVSARFRDVRQALTAILPLLMFASCVVVPVPTGSWGGWMRWNPLVGVIEGFRRCILDGAGPNFSSMAYCLTAGVLLFGLALWNYRSASRRFAETL